MQKQVFRPKFSLEIFFNFFLLWQEFSVTHAKSLEWRIAPSAGSSDCVFSHWHRLTNTTESNSVLKLYRKLAMSLRKRLQQICSSRSCRLPFYSAYLAPLQTGLHFHSFQQPNKCFDRFHLSNDNHKTKIYWKIHPTFDPITEYLIEYLEQVWRV